MRDGSSEFGFNPNPERQDVVFQAADALSMYALSLEDLREKKILTKKSDAELLVPVGGEFGFYISQKPESNYDYILDSDFGLTYDKENKTIRAHFGYKDLKNLKSGAEYRAGLVVIFSVLEQYFGKEQVTSDDFKQFEEQLLDQVQEHFGQVVQIELAQPSKNLDELLEQRTPIELAIIVKKD